MTVQTGTYLSRVAHIRISTRGPDGIGKTTAVYTLLKDAQQSLSSWAEVFVLGDTHRVPETLEACAEALWEKAKTSGKSPVLFHITND